MKIVAWLDLWSEREVSSVKLTPNVTLEENAGNLNDILMARATRILRAQETLGDTMHTIQNSWRNTPEDETLRTTGEKKSPLS